jgi:hypothetical protein
VQRSAVSAGGDLLLSLCCGLARDLRGDGGKCGDLVLDGFTGDSVFVLICSAASARVSS